MYIDRVLTTSKVLVAKKKIIKKANKHTATGECQALHPKHKCLNMYDHMNSHTLAQFCTAWQCLKWLYYRKKYISFTLQPGYDQWWPQDTVFLTSVMPLRPFPLSSEPVPRFHCVNPWLPQKLPDQEIHQIQLHCATPKRIQCKHIITNPL